MRMRRRARQAGFTLIELMVALLVSTLLVGMILAIFARVSMAYRSQQQVAGLQQVLASARGMMELDAKQAGLGISQLSVKLLKHGTLKSYPGLPHGMPTTHAELINADLLAFIKG